jgi:putative ubiquitin-RnfH superfamily antitoxin RatB of RatAB toxin-antitoxin module
MAEISVQVCYATPEWEFLEDLRLPGGATIEQALHASSLAARLPGFDPAGAVVGIYGKKKTLDAPLRERDRVEVYRPLLADPKEARRRRAAGKAVADKAVADKAVADKAVTGEVATGEAGAGQA